MRSIKVYLRLIKAITVVVDDIVVVNVVVVALLVVTDHIIYNCGQYMLIWGFWRLPLSFCVGVEGMGGMGVGGTVGQNQGAHYGN